LRREKKKQNQYINRVHYNIVIFALWI